MESSHKTRKIIEYSVLCIIVGILIWAGLAQFSSPLVKALAKHGKEEIHITLQTAPVMRFNYSPYSQKTVVSVSTEKYQVKKQGKPMLSQNERFFIPETTDRDKFWNRFKYVLSSWRYNPLLAAELVWDYLQAWHDKRTNLTPAEFILLGMELSKLTPSDFAVRFPSSSKTSKKRSAVSSAPEMEDMAPLAVKDRPIVVEIFNASGKRGLALSLTQYLREQNEKGLLRVDVLQYDNYPSYQEKSFIVDYSGRLVQVKQLSQAIGINSEIQSENSPNAICDTRIVLGKDFEMPL